MFWTLEFDTTIDWFNYEENENGIQEYHRNTGRVIMFVTTESLTNLAKGRGILVNGTFKGNFNEIFIELKSQHKENYFCMNCSNMFFKNMFLHTSKIALFTCISDIIILIVLN